MRRSLPTALLLLGACSDAPRVGVVDVEEVFQRSPLAMIAAHRIRSEVGGAEREIKKRGRALAELRQQLEHGGERLDGAGRRALAARIERESASLVEFQRTYRADLAAAQALAGEETTARIEEVAREVAESQGFDLLVRQRDLLYSRPGADLTGIDLTPQVARALLDKINPTEIPQPSTVGEEP